MAIEFEYVETTPPRDILSDLASALEAEIRRQGVADARDLNVQQMALAAHLSLIAPDL